LDDLGLIFNPLNSFSSFDTATGQVFSFGKNEQGQLGDGTDTKRNLPVAISTSGVLNGKTITAISAFFHSLVLSCEYFDFLHCLGGNFMRSQFHCQYV